MKYKQLLSEVLEEYKDNYNNRFERKISVPQVQTRFGYPVYIGKESSVNNVDKYLFIEVLVNDNVILSVSKSIDDKNLFDINGKMEEDLCKTAIIALSKFGMNLLHTSGNMLNHASQN